MIAHFHWDSHIYVHISGGFKSVIRMLSLLVLHILVCKYGYKVPCTLQLTKTSGSKRPASASEGPGKNWLVAV